MTAHPRAPVPPAERLINAIDLSAPAGRYAIDALAPALLGEFTEDPVRLARRIVKRAGLNAWHEAHEVVNRPEEHERSRSLLERLERLQKECVAVEQCEGWFGFIPVEVQEDDDPLMVQFRAAHDLRSASAAFRAAIEKFTSQSALGSKPSLRRARPLERAFVTHIRWSWREAASTRLQRSRGGLEFVRAAWNDLRLPELGADDDVLAIYMGRMSED